MNSTGTVLCVRATGAGGVGDGAIDALEVGFDVVVAEGAVDAVKRLSVDRESPDCVVAPASLDDLPLDAFLGRIADSAPGTPVVLVGPPPSDAAAAEALADAAAYVPPGREDTLADRVDRLVQGARVDESIERHRRLAEVVADIAVEVAGAPDRAAIEAVVHDTLATDGPYRHVWIGAREDGEALSMTAPVAGGLERAEIEALVGGGDPAFVDEALETGRVVSTKGSVPTRSGAAVSAPSAVQDGGPTSPLSSAAVPFVHDGRVWGVGLVSTERSGAFDGSERALLSDLGTIVGHAIWAIESAEAAERTDASAEGLENLVHELRNPLGIAKSHLEIAREDGDVGALDRVESALDRLVETVDRASISAGGPPSIDASRRELREDVALAWQSIEATEADLEVVDSESFVADHDLVVRLLGNLLQNAVEHGGEAVSIRVGTLPGGFYVEDDGVGIPPEEREAVLERGYSTAASGLGIGLNIVEDVASAHGWEVSMGDGADGGVRFEVTGVDSIEGEEGG